MHAASLTKSHRLMRVNKLLSTGKTYTTRQIAAFAQVEAVSAVISELRENIRKQGKMIRCKRAGDRWYYTMIRG